MMSRKRRVFLQTGTIILSLAALAGCASQRSPYNRYYSSSGAYRAPGSASDPWGPYILQAASRFSIPQDWIRAVIHQESGGHQFLDGRPITSHSGAMGLMQLMPQTYADMRSRYGLRADPYEPHDNIMAGTGYISILARKYGAPAFLAAYNAGPQRLEDYLSEGRQLPNETVNYVASITPHLGTQVAMTGPLAAYASADQLNASQSGGRLTPIQTASAPVMTASRSVGQVWASRHVTSAAAQMPIAAPSAVPCNPDDAYDPDVPCAVQPVSTPQLAAPAAPLVSRPAGDTLTFQQPVSEQALPSAPSIPTPHTLHAAPTESTTMVVGYRRPGSYGPWAVQVGAFGSIGQAKFAATMARQAAFTSLQSARIEVHPTPSHGATVWRARLTGISRIGAAQACSTLSGQGMACMAVPPGH
ncbi:transglycosylase SLT domain-containing protein [Gluconobacter sp. Dm-62]|uniref:lytic transglycosylase domain-containing protein n=1 Tax=Gluconobacter sp. Dm-62 TaxID=2799804 RepID=UPI001B8AE390|nr:lytic transglycosylase domain-containing protein [Gluconobacter sp. Dm-62]MBS1102540.1 transglycosylase SLT domain-containing protein [Gluconobacter sp. Dm-62]